MFHQSGDHIKSFGFGQIVGLVVFAWIVREGLLSVKVATVYRAFRMTLPLEFVFYSFVTFMLIMKKKREKLENHDNAFKELA